MRRPSCHARVVGMSSAIGFAIAVPFWWLPRRTQHTKNTQQSVRNFSVKKPRQRCRGNHQGHTTLPTSPPPPKTKKGRPHGTALVVGGDHSHSRWEQSRGRPVRGGS